MNRILATVALVAVFAAAYLWFSRQKPPAPPVAPVVAAEDSRIAERRDLFGDEALAPEVRWRESGLGYRIIDEGRGQKPGIGQPVRLTYVGRLRNGTIFDRAETPSEFLIGTTVPGLSTGLQMLGTGGKAVFYIPPSLAYGNRKVMGIPPGSGLIFEVEVVGVKAL